MPRRRDLFEQTSERVYRLLLRMTGNADDAANLTQETYVKGLQGLDRSDGRSSIASWLYRIAINEALQLRRRNRTARLKLGDLATTHPDATDNASLDVSLDVTAALLQLPPDDQTVLLLRYQEALDYRAAADVLNCAEGTVASRLNRARERLKEFLRKSYGKWEDGSRRRHPTEWKRDRIATRRRELIIMCCEQIERQLGRYIDGELPASDRAQIDAHLESCANCRSELTELREIVDDIAQPRPVSVPPPIFAAIEQRLEQADPARRFGNFWFDTMPSPRRPSRPSGLHSTSTSPRRTLCPAASISRRCTTFASAATSASRPTMIVMGNSSPSCFILR